jgi:hypothetical protein
MLAMVSPFYGSIPRMVVDCNNLIGAAMDIKKEDGNIIITCATEEVHGHTINHDTILKQIEKMRHLSGKEYGHASEINAMASSLFIDYSEHKILIERAIHRLGCGIGSSPVLSKEKQNLNHILMNALIKIVNDRENYKIKLEDVYSFFDDLCRYSNGYRDYVEKSEEAISEHEKTIKDQKKTIIDLEERLEEGRHKNNEIVDKLCKKAIALEDAEKEIDRIGQKLFKLQIKHKEEGERNNELVVENNLLNKKLMKLEVEHNHQWISRRNGNDKPYTECLVCGDKK